MGNIGVGRIASCLLIRLVRRGRTGVANAGEDDGIAGGASLNGVRATGLSGAEAIAIQPCPEKRYYCCHERVEKDRRVVNLALQGGAFHDVTMDVLLLQYNED